VRRLEQGAVARQCGVRVMVMYLLKAQFGHWWSRWLVCHDFTDDYADASDGDYKGVERQKRVIFSWPALLLIEKRA
jgi:hypothetical protein